MTTTPFDQILDQIDQGGDRPALIAKLCDLTARVETLGLTPTQRMFRLNDLSIMKALFNRKEFSATIGGVPAVFKDFPFTAEVLDPLLEWIGQEGRLSTEEILALAQIAIHRNEPGLFQKSLELALDSFEPDRLYIAYFLLREIFRLPEAMADYVKQNAEILLPSIFLLRAYETYTYSAFFRFDPRHVLTIARLFPIQDWRRLEVLRDWTRSKHLPAWMIETSSHAAMRQEDLKQQVATLPPHLVPFLDAETASLLLS